MTSFLTTPSVLISFCLLFSTLGNNIASDGTLLTSNDLKSKLGPFLEKNCLDCHDSDTKTSLNLETLSFDLNQVSSSKSWERIYDRVHEGEMPPKKRPGAEELNLFLGALEKQLTISSSQHQKKYGRVPVRRLTRVEYEYSLQDLLQIHCDLKKYLPPENNLFRFDPVDAPFSCH